MIDNQLAELIFKNAETAVRNVTTKLYTEAGIERELIINFEYNHGKGFKSKVHIEPTSVFIIFSTLPKVTEDAPIFMERLRRNISLIKKAITESPSAQREFTSIEEINTNDYQNELAEIRYNNSLRKQLLPLGELESKIITTVVLKHRSSGNIVAISGENLNAFDLQTEAHLRLSKLVLSGES